MDATRNQTDMKSRIALLEGRIEELRLEQCEAPRTDSLLNGTQQSVRQPVSFEKKGSHMMLKLEYFYYIIKSCPQRFVKTKALMCSRFLLIKNLLNVIGTKALCP